MKHTLFACLVALGAASCASSSASLPKQAQIGAHSSLDAAERIVAPHRPMVDADTHLAMARKDVETGDRYVAEGDYELARFYYERAQGEADVAIAQARAKTAENKVALLEKEVDREEVED